MHPRELIFFLLGRVGVVLEFLDFWLSMCSHKGFTMFPKFPIAPHFIPFLCLKFYSCNLYKQPKRKRLIYYSTLAGSAIRCLIIN
jgi:hypothetical protein